MARPKKTTLKRPIRRLTQAELDSFLEKAADILRGNVDHSEFRGYVFALLFFKRISDIYEGEVRRLTYELGDEELALDPKMHNFVVPNDCIWANVARNAPKELGSALNDAMIAIERANQPKFDGILTNKIDFNKADELPREKLVTLINHFSSQVFDRGHVPDDLFGNAYEYLIRSFASRAGKSSGEFYTPREVAFLLAEMVEPQPGHSVCDWASGSGGLLLQCRNYVRRHHGTEAVERLELHAQESNPTTYNISRINMILHGVKGWQHRQGDSLRNPRLLDDDNRLLTFDRILMNPPFSLEDWGYDDYLGGDPHDRFKPTLPPRDNGDYAWLLHVVKSLKHGGKAIIVMSQGVLFRGQPEQTEAVDGRNQKADAEHVLRESFVNRDLIECVVVLPSKLFYGNNVPGCLIVLNKNKAPARKGKILMIWASRHFQKSNPQNLLRPSDLVRILVPWQAFGDLERAKQLVPDHEARLVREEEAERDRRMKDIEDAYAPLVDQLPLLETELADLQSADFKAWKDAPTTKHLFFGSLVGLSGDKVRLKAATAEAKKAYTDRMKELTRDIKDVEKLRVERDEKEAEVRTLFDREIQHIHAAAADLSRIVADPTEANRHFIVAEASAILENEFNLNLPRYVDTFEPEVVVPLPEAVRGLTAAVRASDMALASLSRLLASVIGEGP